MNSNCELGLVSVILPLYRVFDYVGEAIDSLKAQTYAHFECLCLDDGSGNGMVDVVRAKIAGDDRFRLYEFENAGMAESRNRGLALSKGEYVTFIDQDDGFHPRFLEEAVGALQRYDADGSVCLFRKIAQNEAVSACSARDADLTATWKVIDDPAGFLLKERDLDINNVWQKVFRRSSLGDLRFRKELFGSDDACFSLEAFLRFGRIVFTEARLHYYRQHDGSVTRGGSSRYTFSKLALPAAVAPLIPESHRALFREASLLQISRAVKDALRSDCGKAERRRLAASARAALRAAGVSCRMWPLGARWRYLRLWLKSL